MESISIAMGSSFKNYIKCYLPGVLNALGDPKVINWYLLFIIYMTNVYNLNILIKITFFLVIQVSKCSSMY